MVQLKEFTWVRPSLGPGELLQAIESAIPVEAIETAIRQSNSQQQRERALPTPLVVALVIALNLWSRDSIVDVLKNLVAGLSQQWVRLGQSWRVPSKSSISEARQRVGPQVMSRLFALIARPQATAQTPGAFLGGFRLMAVDGTAFDVPDTDANARVFGYPGSRRGTRAAFPKARLVFLVEAGTHLFCDALISPYRFPERKQVRRLLRSLEKDMLLMWDRGLHSFRMVYETLSTGAYYLGRVPSNVKFEVAQVLEDGSYLSWIAPDRKSRKQGATRLQVRVIEYTIEQEGTSNTYRLITNLLDITLLPALLLAQQYHQRWEAENTLDEWKTHLNSRKLPVRSKTPRLAIQEIYGWLLAHWAVRHLMFQAARRRTRKLPVKLSCNGAIDRKSVV